MARMSRTIEPAVRQLLYSVPAGVSYIDLAKDLSIVNRRLYRQGYTYVVQDIQIGLPFGMKATDVYQISFGTVGNSWIVHNAWRKAFSAWRKEQRKVTEALGNIAGTWEDFKIYLDDSMEDSSNLLAPYASDGAAYSTGEWEYSKFVFDDDGTERELKMHMIGSSNLADTNNESGIGLINEYQVSRPTATQDPTVPGSASDSIYAKLMGTDEMSDMIVDNVEGDNDFPPYAADDYPGGAINADAAVIVRYGSVNATQSTANLGGFIAPCGLIKVQTNEAALDGSSEYADETPPAVGILLTVAAGPYRGVLATPMGQ